jgi:hypothetical protein
MKASELVVGRYYQADIEFPKGSLSAKLGFGEDRVFQLTKLINRVIWASYGNSLELKNFIRPVPLTEDWLDKFGVKFGFGPYVFEYMFDKFHLRLQYDVGMSKHIAKLEFVHQLQNLYHSLTGEELDLE